MVSATTRAIADGEIDVSTWSDEELLRGQRKDANGRWRGAPPKLLPAKVVKELQRRRFQRAYVLLSDSLVDAVQMLRAVVNDKRAPRMARLRAAEVILDRVLGKPRESVAVEFGARGDDADMAPWQKIIATSIVGTAQDAIAAAGEAEAGDDDDEDVVEGELVDETVYRRKRRKR